MKKFFSAIGRFLKENYWLPPLVLVALVFVLVFSLQGVNDLAETFKQWFSPDAKCRTCENVRVNKSTEALKNIKEGEVVYIYYYETYNDETTNNVYASNKALNTFITGYNKDLKANGQSSVKVYAVNYGVKEYMKVNDDQVKTYRDTKMDDATYKQISEEIRLFLTETKPSTVSSYGVNAYTLTAPVLVRYVGTANGYKVDNVLFSRNASEVFNNTTLKLFFNGEYEDIE